MARSNSPARKVRHVLGLAAASSARGTFRLMMTPRRAGLPGVQILRGLATFLVLVHHVLEEGPWCYFRHSNDHASKLVAAAQHRAYVPDQSDSVRILLRPCALDSLHERSHFSPPRSFGLVAG